MIVKNTTSQNVSINKSVQIDVNNIDPNDGYVLPGQTLDLSSSISYLELTQSELLKENIYNGNLVFVVNGIEIESSLCIQIYESGMSEWAKIFIEEISKANLYEGLASGFIYAKNCLIG